MATNIIFCYFFVMKLKELRIRNGLTQAQVGKALNMSGTGYGYYESGKNEPNNSALITLADLFHVSVDELLEHEQPNTLNLNLLSEEEQKIIKIMKELSKDNLLRLEAYAQAKLDEQSKN